MIRHRFLLFYFVGAVISVILLILNAYTKDFQLVETAQAHQQPSDVLELF
ncbi:hypothetical protein ACUOBA_48360, partial [Escherichia coli]